MLALPPAAAPGRADGLWQSTCFELFLLDPQSGAYREFNFAPSGQWAAYSFDSYRVGMRPMDVMPPNIISTDPDQFALAMEARMRALGLDEESIHKLTKASPPMAETVQFALSAGIEDPSLADDRRWVAGLSAVIEEADGTKSYWALAHPDPEKPDFHHPGGFVLELPPAK